MAYPYDDSDPFAQPDAHFPPPPYGQIQGEPLPLFPYGYPPMVGGLNTNPTGAPPSQPGEDAGSTGSGEAPPQQQPMHHLQEIFGMPPEEPAEGPLAEVASVIQSWYGVHGFDPQPQQQEGGFGGWDPSPSGTAQDARATPVPPPLQQPHSDPTEHKDEPEHDSDPLAYLNGLAKSDYGPFAHVPAEDTLSGAAAWRLTVDPFPFSSGLEGAGGLPLQTVQGMRPDVLAKHAKDVEEVSTGRGSSVRARGSHEHLPCALVRNCLMATIGHTAECVCSCGSWPCVPRRCRVRARERAWDGANVRSCSRTSRS